MSESLKYTEEDLKRARKDSEFQATVLSAISSLDAYVKLEFTNIRKAIETMDSRMTSMELHKADKTEFTSFETRCAQLEKKHDDLVEQITKEKEDKFKKVYSLSDLFTDWFKEAVKTVIIALLFGVIYLVANQTNLFK